MATWYQSSEDEAAARQRLHNYNVELRAIVLDLLSIIGRATGDPYPATADTLMGGEAEQLRRRAFEIEHRDAIIYRARRMIDTTADAGRYVGPRTETAQKPEPPTETSMNESGT